MPNQTESTMTTALLDFVKNKLLQRLISTSSPSNTTTHSLSFNAAEPSLHEVWLEHALQESLAALIDHKFVYCKTVSNLLKDDARSTKSKARI